MIRWQPAPRRGRDRSLLGLLGDLALCLAALALVTLLLAHPPHLPR